MSELIITLDSLWEEAGFKPNEEQERAIRHIDGPLYLTAGPGLGKTRVLLWRTVNLIVFEGVKPKKYCIDLPRIIRNYNPDWGVVYEDTDQQTKLELVRKTKGSMDKEALRFEHEKLKITCAERYYQRLGVDYRQITDKVMNWQEPAGSEVVQGQVL